MLTYVLVYIYYSHGTRHCKNDVRGVGMVGFNTIELFHQWIDFNEEEGTYRGVKTASQDTLEELIAADTDKKLREFTAQWFPFMSVWKSWERPDFEEEVKAASDTRDLMLLVLELKRMADEDDCSREAFERLGVAFSRGGTEKHEQAFMYYLASSDSFSKYIRATNHCKEGEKRLRKQFAEMIEREYPPEEAEAMGDPDDDFFATYVALGYASKERIEDDHLYLKGQEERVSGLNPEGKYPVMSFFGGNFGKSISCSKDRALWFIDHIFRPCLQGVWIETEDGILAPKADTNFTSLWVCLADSFRESRVTACKTCGLPIIVSGERGTKRLYCNDTCKRKYKRALKFASLVNDDGMDLQDAAKASGMAAATATRILERNGIYVNSAQ